MPIHLALTEESFVFVPLVPVVDTLAIHHVSVPATAVGAAILEDCESLAVLLVAGPGAIVFGHHTIIVALATEELKTVPVAHHFKRLWHLLGCK